MKTQTNNKILTYIKENPGVSANNIIQHFGLNATGIFRHLKKILNKNQIYKLGKPPRVTYFIRKAPATEDTLIYSKDIVWVIFGDSSLVSPSLLYPTRDVFQARLDRLMSDLKKIFGAADGRYLLVAVIGEIGNNSFDHNIGQWRDEPGVYFKADLPKRKIFLADRGQGLFATLRRVMPAIHNEAQALDVAFTQFVSGRAPEQRGNGLKFVKKVVIENHWHLFFYSGQSMATISDAGLQIDTAAVFVPGTFCVIQF